MDDELGPLSEKHRMLVVVLETVPVERFLPYLHGCVGRPSHERAALARAFVARAVFNLPTTRILIDYLMADLRLRRLCGFERRRDIPSEATFSRAFAEFAASHMPARMHEALITATLSGHVAGHDARDSTAIEVREKPVRKPEQKQPAKKGKRGRPRRGEAVPPPKPTRIRKQRTQSLAAMLADLPKGCDVGCKQNAKGYRTSWTGYKLHIDTIDGDIPVSALLTSASVHDSQVAIPLATMTATRLTVLYDLMDSAYDNDDIRADSRARGHVPLIDTNPRRDATRKQELEQDAKARRVIHMPTAEDIRYRQRSSAERVNSNLKDNFGGRDVRVRGHDKVYAHLMFGIFAIAAIQLMRLVT